MNLFIHVDESTSRIKTHRESAYTVNTIEEAVDGDVVTIDSILIDSDTEEQEKYAEYITTNYNISVDINSDNETLVNSVSTTHNVLAREASRYLWNDYCNNAE